MPDWFFTSESPILSTNLNISIPLTRQVGNVKDMLTLNRCFAVLAVAAALSPIAAAQTRYAGPEVGLYFPSDSVLKDALGNQWISFGVTTMRQGTMQSQGIGTNWNVTSNSKNGNKVFMGSYTLGITKPFGDVGSQARPYFALRGGLSYIDYALTTNGNRISGKRLGYDANAEVGIMFGDRLTLSARYDVFSKHDGLKFDGLTLNLKYGLAKF